MEDIWTIDGLARLGQLMKLTYRISGLGNRNAWARFIRKDGSSVQKLEESSEGRTTPRESNIRSLGGLIWIPDLGLDYWIEEKQQINHAACFTGGELQSIARGVIAPRVSDNEDRPPLSRAILHQMKLTEDTYEDIAHASGLSESRVRRVVAIGGWGVGSVEEARASFFELLNLGTWYGDWKALTLIYSPDALQSTKPAYKEHQGNGAHR